MLVYVCGAVHTSYSNKGPLPGVGVLSTLGGCREPNTDWEVWRQATIPTEPSQPQSLHFKKKDFQFQTLGFSQRAQEDNYPLLRSPSDREDKKDKAEFPSTRETVRGTHKVILHVVGTGCLGTLSQGRFIHSASAQPLLRAYFV